MATPKDVQIVRFDEGQVNARILARQSKADFRRVELASVKIIARLTSSDGKRMLVRYFPSLQLNMYFTSVIAPSQLDVDLVDRIEEAIKEKLQKVTREVNKQIDEAEMLFKSNGIVSAASYDTQPLEIEIGVLSAIGRRYLELIVQFDQLMPLLQTLEIHEIIKPRTLEQRRAAIRKKVKGVAELARQYSKELERRMNALSTSSLAPSRLRSAGEAGDQAPPNKSSTAIHVDGDVSPDIVAASEADEAASQPSSSETDLVGTDALIAADHLSIPISADSDSNGDEVSTEV